MPDARCISSIGLPPPTTPPLTFCRPRQFRSRPRPRLPCGPSPSDCRRHSPAPHDWWQSHPAPAAPVHTTTDQPRCKHALSSSCATSDLVHVLAAQRLACTFDGALEPGLELRRADLSDHSFAFFSTSYVKLSRRFRVSISSRRSCPRSRALGVLHHLLNLALREPARRFDPDLLFLAGCLVLRRHVKDAVRIDVERHLDLRHAARCRRNPGELELADGLVARRPGRARPAARGSRPCVWLSSAVENISDFLVGIVVFRGMSTVVTPPNVSMPSDSGVHVEQQHVLLLAGQHSALNRGADRDDFVRVHALVRLLLEEVLDDLLHLRNARRAADENHLVDLLGLHARRP